MYPITSSELLRIIDLMQQLEIPKCAYKIIIERTENDIENDNVVEITDYWYRIVYKPSMPGIDAPIELEEGTMEGKLKSKYSIKYLEAWTKNKKEWKMFHEDLPF